MKSLKNVSQDRRKLPAILNTFSFFLGYNTLPEEKFHHSHYILDNLQHDTVNKAAFSEDTVYDSEGK